MITIDQYRKRLQPIAYLVGLAALFLGTSACAGIIEVIPAEAPTPLPAAAAQPTPNVEAVTSRGRPQRIASLAIGLDAPVAEMGWQVVERLGQSVSEWEMPDDDAAWHRNSAWPGQGGNVVISGHNASTGGQVFSELDELQIGDEITLWNEKQEAFVYQLTEKNIVRTFASSDEAQTYLRSVTEPTPSEQLTLITCWPRWSNTHRLIVIAEPRQE